MELKKILLLFFCIVGVATLSYSQQNDPRLGTIKVRKYQEQQFYVTLESVPRYKDGSDALLDDIQKGIIYPLEAQEAKIDGTVMVKTIIDAYGNVINTSIDYSPNPLLNSAAMAAAKSLKKFEPYRLKDKAVSSQFVLPIKFILPL